MKNLIIVESPAKAKTIEKYLGSDYKVLSSVGHIRDLAKTGPGGLGVDVEHEFTPNYTHISGKKKIINELKKESKKSLKVYIATDPDREGEAIGWHLADELELNITDENRVVFNEITKNGVKTGMEHPRKLDMNLVSSQESRRIIDRILGFKLSKLLQQKIKEKSAGRVQSVALRLIVEREEEIQSFVAQEYWRLVAHYQQLELNYELNEKKLKREVIEKVYEDLITNKKLTVEDIQQKAKKQNAYLPFTTSTFQQAVVNTLGYSSKTAMSIAQKLYEGVNVNGETQGLITYMRTDSTRLSNDFVKEANQFITNEFGKEYIGVANRGKKKANTQDGHEAIRPTSINNTPQKIKSFLSPQELKVYTLIFNRAVSSLMAPAVLNTKTYKFIHEADHIFKYSLTTVTFEGYRKLYRVEDDKITPDLNVKVGDIIDVDDFEKTQHFTQPKSRFTEARLIKELEEQGIGRPSTYASIIDVLKTRNYVLLDGKSFVPSESGILVIQKLKEFFNSFINVEYTSQLEQALDLIAEGQGDKVELLTKFYNDFIPLLDQAMENMEKIEAVETGNICPECGHKLVMRKGRFGEFEACSNFPECRYITQAQVNEVGDCPKCDGKVIEKQTRRGKVFYSCQNYPKCDYAVWNLEDVGKIIEQPEKKKRTTKKVAAKKTTAKKAPAKKPAAKKTTTKKTTTKKATTKKKAE